MSPSFLPLHPLPNGVHTQSDTRLSGTRRLTILRLLSDYGTAATPRALLALPYGVQLRPRTPPWVLPNSRGPHRSSLTWHPPTVTYSHPQLHPALPNKGSVHWGTPRKRDRRPHGGFFAKSPSAAEDGVRLHRIVPCRSKTIRQIDFFFFLPFLLSSPIQSIFCSTYPYCNVTYDILMLFVESAHGNGNQLLRCCLVSASRSGDVPWLARS